ncbi:MAG: SDR family NAD(P)-dependent oxidoreductase [Actinomycetia bacterium]|nr:SDR family NAD(P)-dependent oxidoreductase [Actinomycetes bacterium]
MDLGLSGKRALVTGASRGIGFACARTLAAEGCDVALAARNVKRLKSAVKTIRAEQRVGVTSHATDLSNEARRQALVDVVGDVDILINNAGAIPPGNLAAVDDDTWRESWELKVFGYINLVRLVLPRMEERGSGVIINVVGAAAVKPSANYVAGATGNSALVGFTRAVGSQSVRHGVRMVSVNPGLILTDRLEELLRKAAEDRYGNAERWDELVPTEPPPGTPEQVADVVTFLASDRASHVSGTTLTIDGGALGL